MALPSSGQLSINDIRTELGTSEGSLHSLSVTAGFSTPDAISDFYGYSGVISPTGSKDTTFNPANFNARPYTIDIYSDQKIIVGGAFTTYSGSTQNYLVKLNVSGSKDTTFNIGTGFNGVVESAVVQSDGKTLVGGQFTTYSGSTENRLVRLNSDGSKDTTFNIGTGFNGAVITVAIDSNNKILVGGQFTTYSGSAQNYLVRLNSDGSKDTTFNIGTGFGAGGVFSIEIQSDGKILVGGNFTTYKGSTQNRLIRLDSTGSKDTTFDIGTGFEFGSIYTTTIQSDGKIIVGGSFIVFNGLTQNRLIRLDSTGSKDTTFNIGTGFGDFVYSTAIQSNGKIVVGGAFTTYKGLGQNRFIRLDSTGSKDTTFDDGNGTAFSSTVEVVIIDSSGRILAGGDFTTYKGVAQNRLIRLV